MRQDPPKHTTDRMRKLIESMEQLPSAPASAARILGIATREFPDFQELVEAIEADPSVSTQLLRLANTAGFNRVEKVDDIRQAAMLLGTDVVRTVALCVCVREGLFNTFDAGDPLVREYWRHSLACACAAKLLAEQARPGLSGAAFAAGLLHDCGKLALISAGSDAYVSLLRDEFLVGQRLVAAEQEALGADHCLAGKWLLERWKLPELFIDAAWMHHQPASALLGAGEHATVSLIVALADRLAHEAMGTVPSGFEDADCLGLASALGLEGPVALREVRAGVGNLFAERAALFDLKEDAASFYFNALGRANRRLGEATLGLAGKNQALERDAMALRRVAQAGVEIAKAFTPQDVLLALARCIQERFASPGGLACVIEPVLRSATGHAWGFGGGPRPVDIPLDESLRPDDSDSSVGLPREFLDHLTGWRTRASALAGPEGPPIHFQDGVAMVTLTDGAESFGELLYRPASGRVLPEERTAVSLLAQLAAQAFRHIELVGRCELRSERLAQVMRSMQDMNDKLLKTQRLAAVGQLAAGAAHEINNPLAIISARAQLLEMREEDQAKKKGLRQMVEQIERISAILGSLMDFARPAAPRMEAMNPRDVMDRVLSLLEGSLGSQGIEVRRDYRGAIPDIKADARQMEQVLLNLALNAQHAMEDAGGVLTAGISYSSENDSVMFSISDTGVGIPRENLEKIFDPFFTTKAEGKGTGLGLSTAYGIVAAHKGRISVTSEPGSGSVFSLVMPRDLTAPARNTGLPMITRTPRQAVLVVDDEQNIREILRESLESKGYVVEVAQDGEVALSLLRQNRYQLMILDIRMPSRDGLSLLREANSFAEPAMPVLVLTGMASEQELSEARALGAAACLRKPFQVEELLELASKLLEEGASR
ncbi:HDOD domain-containing protein [Fundidesulfovibrio putealis]|uniref:HDOD domain-containing protein n=1 Tax=Fundidesulfovibrio putealis TaxID=270496 RepID=UPI0004253126|nr:HDOD domain-containing protein [Fundidesulfovibrio putealis]